MAILGQSMWLSNLLSRLLFCQSRGQLCPYCLAPEKPLTTRGFHQLETYLPDSSFTAALTQRLRSHKCLDWGPTEDFSLGWHCFQCFLVFQWLKVKSGAGDWINKVLVQWHINPSLTREPKTAKQGSEDNNFQMSLDNPRLILEEARVYERVCVCDAGQPWLSSRESWIGNLARHHLSWCYRSRVCFFPKSVPSTLIPNFTATVFITENSSHNKRILVSRVEHFHPRMLHGTPGFPGQWSLKKCIPLLFYSLIHQL